MMEKKRSIGVTILAVMTMLACLLALPYWLDPKSAIEPYNRPFGIILYVLSFPLTILELILAINVLKLKEWARKYLVILTSCYLISMFSIPLIENKDFERKMIKEMQASMSPTMEDIEFEGVGNYQILSTSGEPVLMRVDYALPENTIRNVAFMMSQKKPDGVYQYEMNAQEGQPLTIEFSIKDNTIANVHLDTPFRPTPENRSADTVLTLLSNDQKEILFTFSWNSDGSVKNVNVRPKIIEPNLESLSPEQKEQILAVVPYMTIKIIKGIFYGIFIIFYLVIIFFFTRSKVKAQFE